VSRGLPLEDKKKKGAQMEHEVREGVMKMTDEELAFCKRNVVANLRNSTRLDENMLQYNRILLQCVTIEEEDRQLVTAN
jgi:hypothetical protein